MIKAVISDIDGTLIDSVDFHAAAWVEAMGGRVGFTSARNSGSCFWIDVPVFAQDRYAPAIAGNDSVRNAF
jgi:phosphoglycolate phosphatase-like HAD superfamily hydrolase